MADSRAAILAWRSLVFTPRYKQKTTATTDRRVARAAHEAMLPAQRCPKGRGSSDPGSRPPPFPASFFTNIVAGSPASLTPSAPLPPPIILEGEEGPVPSKFSPCGCTTSWWSRSPRSEVDLSLARRPDQQQAWTILILSPLPAESEKPPLWPRAVWRRGVTAEMQPTRAVLLTPQDPTPP